MTAISKERVAALDAALAKIDKQHGAGAAFRLGEKPRVRIEAISTGSIGLDIAMGIGGIARGRVIEIYGPESSGKTTLTLHAIANAQKDGLLCAFIDAEHALDPEYAANLGVDIDNLVVSQPDNGEQALEIADTLIHSGAIGLIVVDSVAALTPRVEIEGEMGDSHVGLQARMMSQALRKITGALSSTGTTIIFINQLREKIGVTYGSPEVTTGGKALKFYASQRLDIRRIAALKEGENIIGNRTKVKVVKNKVAPPFKQVEFDIIYGEGISREADLIEQAMNLNLIKKAGAWFSDVETSTNIGQGKEKTRQFLKDNPEYADELETKIKRALGFDPNAEIEVTEEDLPDAEAVAAAVEAEVEAEAREAAEAAAVA